MELAFQVHHIYFFVLQSSNIHKKTHTVQDSLQLKLITAKTKEKVEKVVEQSKFVDFSINYTAFYREPNISFLPKFLVHCMRNLEI